MSLCMLPRLLLLPVQMYGLVFSFDREVIRFAQAKFIQWDKDMYFDSLHHHATARTSDVNEDLGQVDYIFTDKTGIALWIGLN